MKEQRDVEEVKNRSQQSDIFYCRALLKHRINTIKGISKLNLSFSF